MALLKKLKKFIRKFVLKCTSERSDTEQPKRFEPEVQIEKNRSEEEFQFDKDQIEKFLNQFFEVTGHSLKEVLELETGTVESIRLKLTDMNLQTLQTEL